MPAEKLDIKHGVYSKPFVDICYVIGLVFKKRSIINITDLLKTGCVIIEMIWRSLLGHLPTLNHY